jgi:hypothetical protein
MEHQLQKLYECAHCKGTGTCNHGKDGEACAACIKKNELKKGTYYGLACGTCGGLGKTDTVTSRMNNRVTPLLGFMLTGLCFLMIILFGFFNNQYFTEVLALCGTLLGSVTGHYFGRQSAKQTQ